MALASPFQGEVVLSPEQVEADTQSRSAFTGLGREAAVVLAERSFHIETPSWTAPGSEAGSKIAQYLSANTASEERPSGKHVLVQSTLPLRVDNGSGEPTPVSVALRDEGGSYVPANPLVPISISKEAATGASFLSSGISVAPASAGSMEAPSVVGNRAVWANTATDTDFISEPMPGGVGIEDSWQLRSGRSPENNALVFKLSPGASLRMSSTVPGGAEVVLEGKALLLIPPASAEGADGRVVPVTYSVSGDVLTTHVDLNGNVDFPVMVDPTVIGWFGEAGGDNAWQNWHTYSTCGGCFGFLEYSTLIQGGAEVGWSEGSYGEWYTGVPTSLLARVWRVDVTGLKHEVENQSSLNIGIWGSNGYEVYSENGYAGATGPAPLVTNKGYSYQSMAFCAQEAGGHDGGEQPLCDECKTYNEAKECTEEFGGEGFYVGDYLLKERNEYNYFRISSATNRYVQTVQPTESLAESKVYTRWMPASEAPYIKSRGEDKGVGVSEVGIDAASGVREAYSRGEHGEKEMPLPGSSPAPGTSPYSPGCNDPWCDESAWKSNFITELSTGVWTLAGWSRNAVGLNAEQTETAYIDKTDPTIETPSWEGATLGDGTHVLNFTANDGSVSAPQSGVESVEVSIDGRYVETAEKPKSCPPPEGSNVIPSESCFSLNGSWTLQGEDYGAGPHTITLIARDRVGNLWVRDSHITIDHAVGDTQQIGPGTLNLRSGDFQLGATDVSLPAGTATLSISRSYQSRSSEPSSGPLGPGWLLSTPDTTGGGQWQSLQVLSEEQVEVTTTGGQKVLFASNGKGGYTPPVGFQTYTLTEPVKSPATYQITDAGGDYTQFTEPSGANSFMPTIVAQAINTGGLNKVVYVLAEGKTHEIVGPGPSGENCSATSPEEWTKERKTEEEHRGCRVLVLNYATETTAKGEGSTEWGNIKGQLESVAFTAWSNTEEKLVMKLVARYEYDKQARLRAEWDPRIEPALKTTYGYDAEDRVTALTPPGQETWAFTYGAISSDPSTGRLLKVTQAPALTGLWKGLAPTNTGEPTLSGSPIIGNVMGVYHGAWSNQVVAYSYQWEDCNYVGAECTAIPGATNENYTPTAGDGGHTLVAVVMAINGGGSVSVTTKASKIVGEAAAEYSVPSGSYPEKIVLGSDGNLWYTDSGTNKIGKITLSGTRTEYALAAGSEPDGITAGPDGNLWYTDYGTGKIGKISTSGSILAEYALPEGSHPEEIAVGPDGNLWYGNTATAKLTESYLGKITTSGAISEYFTTYGATIGAITAGPEGDMWLADYGGQKVGRTTTWGETLSLYSLGESSHDPWGITTGSEGNMWFTVYNQSEIGKITTAGSVTEYKLPAESRPDEIVQGFNGNYWYTDSGTNKIGEITTSGTYTQYSLPSGSLPRGITRGPNGDLWYVSENTNKIGKIPSRGNGTVTEGTKYSPGLGTTIEYNVPVSGSGAPDNMSATEVEKWGEKDHPAEATAIFPPDEPQSWPASDYRRASIVYFDSTGRLVNSVSPSGAISTTQYETYDNPEWTLTPENRQRALEAGSESVKKAELLDTKSAYEDEGAELESRLGPQHEVKLSSGTVSRARARTKYFYDESAPSGGPYRLVTKTTEGALLESGEEKDKRTVKTSYSGQSDLGWELHKPTSFTVEPESGKTLTRTTLYNSETGDATEVKPAGGSGVTPSPVYSSQFGSEGTENGQFKEPRSVVIAKNGNLLVLDSSNSRVEEFSPAGKYEAKFGASGSASGQLKAPYAMTVDSKGNIWIADTGNNRIDEFNEKHEFIDAFGFGVANGEEKLQTCTSVCKVGIAGTGTGQVKEPKGIAITTSGGVYVADSPNNRMEEFTEKGEFVAAFGFGVSDEKAEYEACTSSCKAGIAGSGNGQFSVPRGIAATSSGNIWVVEDGSNRLQEFNE